MAKLEVRPATRADIVAFGGECRHTTRAVVGIQSGKVIALGGIATVRGRQVAFCELSDEARKYPKTLHREARKVMHAARISGAKFIFAERDENEPTAMRWLKRLGFKPIDESGMVMLWQV